MDIKWLDCIEGPSWLWSFGSWIYFYICNQWLSPLKLWVRIPLRWGVLDTTLCDKACRWLVTGRWFSLGTPVSSINKTDCHNIAEILLKLTLNILRPKKYMCVYGHPTDPIFQPPTLTFFIGNYSTLILASDPINFYTEFG
jgi:hypothetical protein